LLITFKVLGKSFSAKNLTKQMMEIDENKLKEILNEVASNFRSTTESVLFREKQS